MAHRTERLVWRLSGRDPIAFLEATTTQSHVGQAVGESRWCCALDPHGRVLAFLRTIPLEDGSVLLDGEPACVEGIGWLRSIAPLSGCTIVDEPGLAVVVDGVSLIEPIARAPRSDGLDGEDLVISRIKADALPAPDETIEAKRIAHGWPRFGLDITNENIVNDTPLLALCVSFTKGCYRGQETVAKIGNLGHARRAYIRVRTSLPAPAGTPIAVDEREIGTVTSSARTDSEVVAIGIVRREHAVAGTVVVAGTEASAVPLVIAEEPPRPAEPPSPPRMGRRFGRR